MMKLGHIEMFVKDPAASKQFYQEVLGFDLVVEQTAQLIWLKSGEIEILLRPGQPVNGAKQYGDAASALVIYTDDLTQSQSLLQSRGLTFKGTDGSDLCLTFTDPDGHWFQLVNPNHH